MNYLLSDKGIERAKSLAIEAHEGQFRKYNKLPYIVHPQAVYEKVLQYAQEKQLPEEQTILMCKAAWLHDVIEDCPKITKERIIDETDESTYNLVLELTNPSKGSKAPRAVRKRQDRDHLAIASWEAKIIKLVDRIVNLSDVHQSPDKDFAVLYAQESELLLDCIKDADESLTKELMSLILTYRSSLKERD